MGTRANGSIVVEDCVWGGGEDKFTGPANQQVM